MREEQAATFTPWFPANVEPVRVGFYERDYGIDYGDEMVPDFWDGKDWYVVPVRNIEERHLGVPTLAWRGLAKKPLARATGRSE